MKIGDAAAKVGVPASTIRYYEKVGLIGPQPKTSGRRVFDERALRQIEFIKLAQSAGFTISEIKQLLELYDADAPGRADWIAIANAKRREIRARIQALEQVEANLKELIACDCRSLDECVDKGRQRTIDA